MGKDGFSCARRINFGVGEFRENGTEKKHFMGLIILEHENLFNIIAKNGQLIQKKSFERNR